MSSRNPISTVILLPVAARRWEFFVEHILGSKQSLFWTRLLRIRKEFNQVFKQAFDNELWNRSAPSCFRGAQNRAHRALLAAACWIWYRELSLAPVQVKSFPRYGLGLCAKDKLILESHGKQSSIPSLTGQLVRVKVKTFDKLCCFRISISSQRSWSARSSYWTYLTFESLLQREPIVPKLALHSQAKMLE